MWKIALGMLLLVGIAAYPRTATHDESERAFVEMEASASLLELRLGDYALTHAKSEALRELARATVTDRAKTHQALARTAKKLDLAFLTGMSDEHRDEYFRVTSLRGDHFDHAYAEALVRLHERARAAFQDRARSRSELGTWASEALPSIESHLTEARALAEATRQPPEDVAATLLAR